MTNKNIVGLDFETYASTDLIKHGLQRYVTCPNFTPLLAVVMWEEDAHPTGIDGAVCDFIEDYKDAKERMRDGIRDSFIAAHNAGFEQAVLARMGIDLPSERFVDTAVLARAAGAAGKLEAAAPQLLGVDKMAVGYELIKLFSIPGKYQEKNGNLGFDPLIKLDHMEEWTEFTHYCNVDAELSLRLALEYPVSKQELANNAVTMDMNNTGWHVDQELVQMMYLRYQINLERSVQMFREFVDDHDLNLNSHPQLVDWCAKRGVRASSFDEAHVESLIKRLEKKLATPTLAHTKVGNYNEVLALLRTKQALGGSSLKKLQTILDTVGTDGRLHDQYLHIGAGATYRTTGRGVQMQNLKRLNGQGDDMELLWEPDTEWDNGKLASNLRQVFTATDPKGQLVVGDFSSVESRGLAWQAGEHWKVKAYTDGRDLYKVQAGLIFDVLPEVVTKEQRQIGKVGELACGYGAGPEAVKDFAEKMGVDLSIGESTKLVKDWRDANPAIVEYWANLDAAMHQALVSHMTTSVGLPHGYVRITPTPAPKSLREQVGDQYLQSLQIRLILLDNTEVVTRVIHGTHEVGHNIQYWKPSERKTGDLWSDEFVNPKTKRLQRYSVYGGKLSGLLTQSLCREVFFHSLRLVHEWAKVQHNVQLIGQFHDEIVLDWAADPGGVNLARTKSLLEGCMTSTILPGFPLAAEIKSDYRYTK